MKHAAIPAFLALVMVTACCATHAATAGTAAGGTGIVAVLLAPLLAVIDAIFAGGGMTDAQHATLTAGLSSLADVVSNTMSQVDALKKTTGEVVSGMPTETKITAIGGGVTAIGLALYKAFHGPGPTPEEKATRQVAHAQRKLAKAKAS